MNTIKKEEEWVDINYIRDKYNNVNENTFKGWAFRGKIRTKKMEGKKFLWYNLNDVTSYLEKKRKEGRKPMIRKKPVTREKKVAYEPKSTFFEQEFPILVENTEDGDQIIPSNLSKAEAERIIKVQQAKKLHFENDLNNKKFVEKEKVYTEISEIHKIMINNLKELIDKISFDLNLSQKNSENFKKSLEEQIKKSYKKVEKSIESEKK